VDSLAQITTEVISCRDCPRLVEWRERVATERRAAYRNETYWGRPVPGFGDPAATLLVVGLAPAAHGGNRTGRVFTGDRSGDWVFRTLWRHGFANQPTSTHVGDGLVLERAWVAAVVRCAPPANKPTPVERDNCVGYLRRELACLAGVRVVVALGRFAFGALGRMLAFDGSQPRPRFGHGVEVALADGRTLLCSYHPSQQNTFTGRLTEEAFDEVFARARRLSHLPVTSEPEPPA